MLHFQHLRSLPLPARKLDSLTARGGERRNPYPEVMASRIVIVSPPGLDRDWLAGCVRKLDPSRPIEFVSPGDGDAGLSTEQPALVVIDLDAPGAAGAA